MFLQKGIIIYDCLSNNEDDKVMCDVALVTFNQICLARSGSDNYDRDICFIALTKIAF